MSTRSARASPARAPHGDEFATRSALAKSLSALGVWLARRAERKALRELAAQEGRLLADIGLNREEALREAAKPFWRQ